MQVFNGKDVELFCPTHTVISYSTSLCMYTKSVSFVHKLFSSTLKDIFLQLKSKKQVFASYLWETGKGKMDSFDIRMDKRIFKVKFSNLNP